METYELEGVSGIVQLRRGSSMRTDFFQVKHTIYSNEPDVILYSDPKHLHHVSSKALSAASPVFRAMLGPSFAEGQMLLTSCNGDLLPTIHLQDDQEDRLGLEWLCWMLHHNNIKCIGDRMISSLVLRFAIIADKYDCVAAIAPLSSSIFEHFDIISTDDQDDLDPSYLSLHNSALVHAAYLLNSAESFQKYTNVLVRNDDYWDLTISEDVHTLERDLRGEYRTLHFR